MINEVKVLIVEDSRLMQQILMAVLSRDPQIKVVGTAANPNIARGMIRQFKPDVLTLDVEMPEMDGITFVEKLMRLNPMPVIMFSSVTQKSSMAALEALELGAFDVVPKPENPTQYELFGPELIEKIKQAAVCRIRPKLTSISNNVFVEKSHKLIKKCKPSLIVIGSSTGGIEALSIILKSLTKGMPPIVIVQHLPPAFILSFVEYLQKISNCQIEVAAQGTQLIADTIYVAPPGFQLGVDKFGSNLVFRVSSEKSSNGHTPSVDHLFSSAALSNASNTLGILLTGMGSDGAKGMYALKANGATTIAQDEESSVVWGMPRSAIELNAVDQVLPINQIPLYMNQVIKNGFGSIYV